MRIVYKVILAVVIIIAITSIGSAALFMYPFYSMAGDIAQINDENANADLTKANFMQYEESQIFIQKHPEYTEELHNTGFEFEYSLKADDAQLRITYYKDSGATEIVYSCGSDGEMTRTYDQDLKDTMMSLC